MLLEKLSSDSESGDRVSTVRVPDRGSRPQYADVQVQGVPASGIVDTGADITIIGSDLFKRSSSRNPMLFPELMTGSSFPLMDEWI